MKKMEHIQVLRALACLGVFVTHLAPRMGVTGAAAKIANFGASGVYLFFLISGYLICMQSGIGPGCGKKELKTYYLKRLFRILPLYYSVVVCNMILHIFILQDVTPDPAGLKWFRYFFLTNAFLPAPDNFWSNLSATWTISLFVVFYLAAPLLRRLMTDVKSSVLLYLAALALRYVWAQTPWSGYMMIFYYLHFFLLGMVIWQLEQRLKSKMATVVLAVGGAAIWSLVRILGQEPDYFTTWSWVFAAVLLMSRGLSLKEGIFRRCVTAVDRYSFSIYLVHALVLDGIVLLQGKITLPAAVVFLLAAGLTAAGTAAAELVIERPSKKLCARLVGYHGM